jgi:hypothetical protein
MPLFSYEEKMCACLSPDAERCMALRYGLNLDDDDVEPCQCTCHDEE